jgi:hypothetical protein
MEMTRELWKASPAMGVTCGPGQRPPRGPTSVILQDRHGGWEEKWMISMLCEEGNVDHVTMALDKYLGMYHERIVILIYTLFYQVYIYPRSRGIKRRRLLVKVARSPSATAYVTPCWSTGQEGLTASEKHGVDMTFRLQAF